MNILNYIRNPVIFALGVGNLFAVAYAWYGNGDWRVGGVYFCYAIANFFMCLVEG